MTEQERIEMQAEEAIRRYAEPGDGLDCFRGILTLALLSLIVLAAAIIWRIS